MQTEDNHLREDCHWIVWNTNKTDRNIANINKDRPQNFRKVGSKTLSVSYEIGHIDTNDRNFEEKLNFVKKERWKFKIVKMEILKMFLRIDRSQNT